MHTHFLLHSSLWSIPSSPPCDSLPRDKPTFSWAHSDGPRGCATPLLRWHVVRAGEQRLVAVAAARLLPSESPCPSISRQGYAWWPARALARVRPWDCNEPLPRSSWIFWVLLSWSAHTVYKGLVFPQPR